MHVNRILVSKNFYVSLNIMEGDMKDNVFVNEFRRRVAIMESRYEALGRGLEASRAALAMFEKDMVNNSQSERGNSHTDLIAEIIVDSLSTHKEMHRAEILTTITKQGVHVGNDDDRSKQLAGLSTLLSKDGRFTPVRDKSGYWALANVQGHAAIGNGVIEANMPDKDENDFITEIHGE